MTVLCEGEWSTIENIFENNQGYLKAINTNNKKQQQQKPWTSCANNIKKKLTG